MTDVIAAATALHPERAADLLDGLDEGELATLAPLADRVGRAS